MASIVVRGLDESVKKRLAAQAKRNGRSMEAEARRILEDGTKPSNTAVDIFRMVRENGGIGDIPIPPREDDARFVDFQ